MKKIKYEITSEIKRDDGLFIVDYIYKGMFWRMLGKNKEDCVEQIKNKHS